MHTNVCSDVMRGSGMRYRDEVPMHISRLKFAHLGRTVCHERVAYYVYNLFESAERGWLFTIVKHPATLKAGLSDYYDPPGKIRHLINLQCSKCGSLQTISKQIKRMSGQVIFRLPYMFCIWQLVYQRGYWLIRKTEWPCKSTQQSTPEICRFQLPNKLHDRNVHKSF